MLSTTCLYSDGEAFYKSRHQKRGSQKVPWAYLLINDPKLFILT